MRERLRPILDNLATFVAPGLVLLLLGIQIAFGLRGFDRPDDSLLYVLQVPGALLGWGGVVLLLPLLVWMVLDWWGYNLGGFALKGLGSAVLGIAAGALCGLVGDVASGGLVGGGLAEVLRQGVGTTIAFVVLALMALPAAILAFSLQKRAPRPTRVPPREDEPAPAPSGGVLTQLGGLLGGGRRRRDTTGSDPYPERRFDADGNEIPMAFERHRDIGGIRFVEPDEPDEPGRPEAEAVEAATDEAPGAFPGGDAPAGEERLPTIPELLAGNYRGEQRLFFDDPSGGPRESEVEEPVGGPIHVDSSGRPRARAAQATWTPPVEVELADDADEPAQQTLAFLPVREQVPIAVEPTLPAGVRWADEPPPEEPADDENADDASDAGTEDPADLPALSAALEHAVRGPAADPDDSKHTARSVRETLRQRVEAIRSDGASSRYMAKLEAIGLFDPAPPEQPKAPEQSEDADEADTGTKKKTARKKSAKKKPARKTSAVRRPAAGKKASARKKPVAREKPGTRKQAAARKPPAAPKPDRLAALRIERLDPLFARAAEAVLARGAASPVLLTRRLGVPLTRAHALIERMIAAGVLEDASPTGSYALRISAKDWETVHQAP